MYDNEFYVGSQPEKLEGPTMQWFFEQMGGKYLGWYQDEVTFDMILLNAGITGARRPIYKEFLENMCDTLSDPELVGTNVNMAALNYVVRKSMGLRRHTPYSEGALRLVTGAPVHSIFKHFQDDRDDV